VTSVSTVLSIYHHVLFSFTRFLRSRYPEGERVRSSCRLRARNVRFRSTYIKARVLQTVYYTRQHMLKNKLKPTLEDALLSYSSFSSTSAGARLKLLKFSYKRCVEERTKDRSHLVLSDNFASTSPLHPRMSREWSMLPIYSGRTSGIILHIPQGSANVR